MSVPTTNLWDLTVDDGLWDAFYQRHMAIHGSEVSDEFGYTRQDQDEWAYHSQMAAAEAIKAGRLDNEIFPVEVREGKKTIVFDKDEFPRPDTTLEALAKLPPVFGHKSAVTGEPGGVTAGGMGLPVLPSVTDRLFHLAKFSCHGRPKELCLQ